SPMVENAFIKISSGICTLLTSVISDTPSAFRAKRHLSQLIIPKISMFDTLFQKKQLDLPRITLTSVCGFYKGVSLKC
ncbi:MAG: hypothetical protein VW122_13080, partial [Paracoccaceae bacterium]